MAQQDSFYPAKQMPHLDRPPVPFIWSSLSPDDTQLFLEDLDLWVKSLGVVCDGCRVFFGS